MKLNPFKFIFLSLFGITLLLSSCLGDSDVTYSDDAAFTSLSLAGNDSVTLASFTAEWDAEYNDSVIVNLDSLPHNTDITSVLPTFAFNSSSECYIIMKGSQGQDTTVTYVSTDSLDFSKVLRVKNISADGNTTRIYPIKINIHQVEPEEYVWAKVMDNLLSVNIENQKAIAFNNKLFYYSNDGTNSYLYTSADGYNWTPETVTGLPVNTPLTDITEFNGSLYLTRDSDKIYSSANGYDWTARSVSDYNFKSLLFVLNGKLWAVSQLKTGARTFHFAYSADGVIWNYMNSEIPANFPVSDFSSISFSYRNGKPKALVFGGYSASGDKLRNNWGTENGTYWVDYSLENTTLDTLEIGSSVISYDDKLFVYGRYSNYNSLYYKVSEDEGLSWQLATDSLLNIIPENIKPRNYQSVVVFKPKKYSTVNSLDLLSEIKQSNRIFIIGGKETLTNPLSDVWTQKLNRLNFLRQVEDDE